MKFFPWTGDDVQGKETSRGRHVKVRVDFISVKIVFLSDRRLPIGKKKSRLCDLCVSVVSNNGQQ